MIAAPALPQDISPDGREIWGWAARLSDHVNRLDKMRQLAADIAKVRCGDCRLWMMKACPREHNVNGYNRGPSMEGIICGKFVEDPSSAALRQRRRDELAELAKLHVAASQENSDG